MVSAGFGTKDERQNNSRPTGSAMPVPTPPLRSIGRPTRNSGQTSKRQRAGKAPPNREAQRQPRPQIGRESGSEREGKYVYLSMVAVRIKKKHHTPDHATHYN